MTFASILLLLAASFAMLFAIVMLKAICVSVPRHSGLRKLAFGLIAMAGIFFLTARSHSIRWRHFKPFSTNRLAVTEISSTDKRISIVHNQADELDERIDELGDDLDSALAVTDPDEQVLLAVKQPTAPKPRPPLSASPAIREVDRLIRHAKRSVSRPVARRFAPKVISGLVLAIFLYLAYLFLDASTRGHFSWSLRLLSILLFCVICFAMAGIH